MSDILPRTSKIRGWALVSLLLLLMAGLPAAVWLDLRNLSERALRLQASDFNSVITCVRSYYATNVVGRVLAAPDPTVVVHNYQSVPGAIPIPARLSLELGQVVGDVRRRSAMICATAPASRTWCCSAGQRSASATS